jgi:2-methylcitrate dehydratase PrpD
VQVVEAVRTMGAFVTELAWSDLPEATTERAHDVLFDTFGVTVAGARTPELRRLQAAVHDDPGPARPLGTQDSVPVPTAAWLDGTAACCLELDEGNKRARGHPAAHVVPALLAVSATRPTSGAEWLAAFVAGHEVATRFGGATRLHPGVHPHGNAGTAGAAAAVARLIGLDADGIAAAIDAATALPLATDFGAALDGSFVRNTWIGQANVSGIAAARLAAAGLATVDGRAAGTLGRILGDLEVDALTDGLGDGLGVTTGYFKRHASCSYTHPPADAALELLGAGVVADEIAEIEVTTHHLAAGLDRRHTPTRLAAMFSIPYVVAATLVHGRFDATTSDDTARRDPRVRRLADATRVVHDPALDERLPDERVARVRVLLADGRRYEVEVPNPIGDADHQPLGRDDLLDKLDGLLAPGEAQQVLSVVTALADAPDARTVLDRLP